MGFPDTQHSAILGLHDRDEEVRRQSYQSVIGAYWEPVCKYLRLRWHQTEEDAADLTQAFFAKTLESSTFRNYDPAKGTFRTYLRTCLDHFVINSRQHRRAQPVPLEVEVADPGEGPEELFHREWVRSLFTLAVDDLRAARDDLRFRIFERYDLNEADARPTYAELAAEFGVTTVSVTNYLSAMRRDLRRAVLERLRGLTATEREFRSEARTILGIEI